ncbi:MAG: AAA family ATPase, partial [Deltaproteobacteria bacterium]|nr:AAA family ATPase [Deltaproteobacteria bacterium]
TALEYPLMGFLIHNPAKHSLITTDLRADHFQDQTARKIFEAMGAMGGDFDAPRLLCAVPHSSLHLTKMMSVALVTSQGPFGAIDAARRIKEAAQRRRAQDLARVIADAARGGSLEDLQSAIQGLTDEPQSQSARFQFMKGMGYLDLPSIRWVIKGLFPSRGIGAVYGPSGSAKSFLVLDAGLAVAEGARSWFGRRVKQRDVVYVCLEGEAGLKKRLNAWVEHHRRPVPPVFMSTAVPFNLMSPADVQALAASVPKGAIVIIDTLNRAAPTADENSSGDMGEILEGAKTLERLTEGLVVLVAHTGKDVSRGLRGHSSLIAALDFSIEVSREGDHRRWIARKVKDGQDGEEGWFKLEVRHLGVDEDGDPETSCVISPAPEPEKPEKPLSGSLKLALSALEAAGGVDVELDSWRDSYYRISPAEPAAKRQAFLRARQQLQSAGKISVLNDKYSVLNFPPK